MSAEPRCGLARTEDRWCTQPRVQGDFLVAAVSQLGLEGGVGVVVQKTGTNMPGRARDGAKPLVLEATRRAPHGVPPAAHPGGRSKIKVFEVGGLDGGYRENQSPFLP